MKIGDAIISSSSCEDYSDALMESLAEAGIPSTLLLPHEVTADDLGNWAASPSHGFVVVPANYREAADVVASRVSRYCYACEAFLTAEGRVCRKCGRPCDQEPQSI